MPVSNVVTAGLRAMLATLLENTMSDPTRYTIMVIYDPNDADEPLYISINDAETAVEVHQLEYA